MANPKISFSIMGDVPKKSRKLKKLQEEPPIELGRKSLHEVLTEGRITAIRQAFLQEEDQQLDLPSMRKALLELGKVSIDDAYFELLFLRMNIKRDGYVTWDEFISHLILGFKIQDVVAEVTSLDNPISKKPQLVRSNHRHPINCITFNFQVKSDRTYSYADGSYITASKDGYINYWSLDMQLERSVLSKTPDLKVTDTYVLWVVCLPDVSVICTSSTERDIRFYDTSARKFELRVHFVALDFAVCSMYYVFNKDVNEESKLLMGDMGGNVLVVLFSPINRGPFRSKLGIPLLIARYENIQKGLVPGFRVVEFRNQHRDWVRQIEYYHTLNFIISCADSTKAVVMRDFNENRGIYNFMIAKGAWCFATAEGFPLIATGSSDCQIRLWNPYVPKRPIVILPGHHTGVTAILLQDKGEFMCSLSEDRCVKVWDVISQVCVQSYLGLSGEVGECNKLTMFYNPESRQLIFGGMLIAVLPLRPLQNGEHTDGNSHSAAISIVLYNPLFKIILTCGLDSLIIVWDPWSGKRISVVRDAHTRILHGENIPVDITAGTFDPGYQLLLTGAFDGTLKTWNFNTGTCLRNMRIEAGCEVTGVVWVKGRILAIGWNRHVTEFSESGGAAGPGGAFSKPWATKHTDDVLAAAARIPQTLATSTYNGELILWQLETGQPYKQYSVANPTHRIKVTYNFEKKSKHAKEKSFKQRKREEHHSMTRKKSFHERRSVAHRNVQPHIEMVLKYTKMRPMVLPATISPIRGQAVRCMLFFQTRPMQVGVASLVIALENGDVQLWSHHHSGGFIGAFQGVHAIGEYVVSMATDKDNDYLFVGSTEGYVKTFLMKGYYSGKQEKICMPLLRLKFPFLWKRFIEGRAKRALRGQLKPILLNSYKSHTAIISGMVYIDDTEILVTSSTDYSARLWTLGGRYLGTLGTFKKWIPLDPDKPVDRNHVHNIPPDVKRVMSSTTYRVFMGYDYKKPLTKKQEAAQAEKEMFYREGGKGIYGKKLADPVLGHYIRLPEKNTQKFEITLDTTFPYIPVYQHIVRPLPKPTPAISHATKENYEKHLRTTKEQEIIMEDQINATNPLVTPKN